MQHRFSAFLENLGDKIDPKPELRLIEPNTYRNFSNESLTMARNK